MSRNMSAARTEHAPLESYITQLEADQPKLRYVCDFLSSYIQYRRTKVRPSKTFDTVYWMKAAAVAETELALVNVIQKIEEHNFLSEGGTPKDWKQATLHAELKTQREIWKDKIGVCNNQAKHFSPSDSTAMEEAVQRSYFSVFWSPKVCKKQHIAYKERLLKAYHTHPTDREFSWDSLKGEASDGIYLTAVHLFPYRHGKHAFAAIFGKEARGELWSTKNGLCIPRSVGRHFNNGSFTIYPNFADDATHEERLAWHYSKIKEYRIRFLDKPDLSPPLDRTFRPLYHRHINAKLHWRDLDGRKICFQGTARPDVRYIYYHFLGNLLHFAWRRREAAAAIVQSELEKPFWGSPEAYIPQEQFRGFVEQMGRILPDLQIPTELTTPMLQTSGFEEHRIMTYRSNPLNSVLIESLKCQVLDSSRKITHVPDEYEYSDDDESQDEEDDPLDDTEWWKRKWNRHEWQSIYERRLRFESGL